MRHTTLTPSRRHRWRPPPESCDGAGLLAAADHQAVAPNFQDALTRWTRAEIRPQVTGRITEIRFKDGQQVKAGDLLFVIDPRPYQAAAAKAAADLQSAHVNAALAKTNLIRAENLRKADAIAAQSYDQAANANDVAVAAIQSAEAALAETQVDVDHAYVKAPISGRISRAEITLGNLNRHHPNAATTGDLLPPTTAFMPISKSTSRPI